MSDAPAMYVMDWDRFGRKGQTCEMLRMPNTFNSAVQVRFEDGFVAVVDRQALRRLKTKQTEEDHGKR